MSARAKAQGGGLARQRVMTGWASHMLHGEVVFEMCAE